jgi:hypothetical protein
VEARTVSKYASFFGLDGYEHDAPLVYLGSHVQPREDDKRGGHLDLAFMPDYCADPEGPVPFLRLGLTQDPSTYGNEHSGGNADVVLDRAQVAALRDALTSWLAEGEDWE